MALLLERKADVGMPYLVYCVDGKFTFDDGLVLTIDEARQLARVSIMHPPKERAWAFRLGYEPEVLDL